MQIRYRRYSKETDAVIMHYVHRSPDNLKQAFRWTAFHLSRSVKGIEQRYYNHLYYNSENNKYFRRDINDYGQKPKMKVRKRIALLLMLVSIVSVLKKDRDRGFSPLSFFLSKASIKNMLPI